MRTLRALRVRTRKSAALTPSRSSDGYTRKKNGERPASSGAEADGERSTRPAWSAAAIIAFASADVTPPITSSAPPANSASAALAALGEDDAHPDSRVAAAGKGDYRQGCGEPPHRASTAPNRGHRSVSRG